MIGVWGFTNEAWCQNPSIYQWAWGPGGRQIRTLPANVAEVQPWCYLQIHGDSSTAAHNLAAARGVIPANCREDDSTQKQLQLAQSVFCHLVGYYTLRAKNHCEPFCNRFCAVPLQVRARPSQEDQVRKSKARRASSGRWQVSCA